jgi:predicted Zn-dependent peptidase
MNMERSAITREKIGDGTILIMDPQPKKEIVAVHLFLRMGSLFEDEEHSGLSNLMQNMLLKGTVAMGSEELDTRLDSIGSKLIPATGKETGSLSLLTTREESREALGLMTEVLLRPAMTGEEFEKERELVLDEIQQRRDELLTHALDLFQKAFYGSHPLHKTVQGNEESLAAMTLETVRAFQEDVYTPDNMIFSCSGGFDPKEMREVVAGIAEGLSSRGGESRNSVLADRLCGKDYFPEWDRLGKSPRVEHEERESSAAWIVLGYPAPSFSDDGYHEMQVINAVLGGSMDSRLFSQLREKKGLAYQVSSVYSTCTGPSFLAGYIGTDPDRYDEAIRELTGEIKRIARDEPKGEELERTKEYLKGIFLIGGETTAARAARVGRFEILGLGYDYGETYLNGIVGVTPESLRAVAEKHFQGYALGAVIPRGLEIEL